MLVHTDAALALSAAETQLEGLFSETTNPAMGIFAQGLAGVAEGLAWAKSGVHSLAEWAPKSAAALSALTTSAIALGGGYLTMKAFMSFMGLGGAQAKLGAAGLALDGSAAALDASAAALNEAAAALATGGKVGALEGGALGAGGKAGAAAKVAAATFLGAASTVAAITGAAYYGASTLAEYVNSVPTGLGKPFNEFDDDELARQQRKLDAMDKLQRLHEAQTYPLGGIAPPEDLVPRPGEMKPYDGPWFSRNGVPLGAEQFGPPMPEVQGPPAPSQGILHDLGSWLVKEMPSVFSRPDKPVDVTGKVTGDAELHIKVDASGMADFRTGLRLDGTIGQSNAVPSGRSRPAWGSMNAYR